MTTICARLADELQYYFSHARVRLAGTASTKSRLPAA